VKISVVIPAYNAAGFLPRCLGSVFAQTRRPDEVIVVDDGSTDDTAAVASGLGAKVIGRRNGGLSAARNTGIQGATGEWIALLDADDMWVPEKLERQAALVRPETVLVYSGIRTFDDKGVRDELPAMDVATARKVLRYRNPITPSTALVRREMVLRDGGFREDIRSCEDWEMWVRLQRLGEFEAIPDMLTEYYVHAQGLSQNPVGMLEALHRILDTTLVADLRGLKRWAWRRRILAGQLCSAGLMARDNRLKGELSYMLGSLCTWPSPTWQPGRFALFAVSALNGMRGTGGTL
jgi:glycosyltransferase involved in cell wall biosynthesis